MKKTILLALLCALVALCASVSGCSSLQTQQHQKIAAACEGAATAADTIAAGTASGRITAAQAKEALGIYRVTVPFCEPEPVDSISTSDYAVLVSAAAQLAALSEKAK